MMAQQGLEVVEANGEVRIEEQELVPPESSPSPTFQHVQSSQEHPSLEKIHSSSQEVTSVTVSSRESPSPHTDSIPSSEASSVSNSQPHHVSSNNLSPSPAHTIHIK